VRTGLTAVARDAAGNTTTSVAVSVTVSNVVPPATGLVAAYNFDAGSGTTLRGPLGHRQQRHDRQRNVVGHRDTPAGLCRSTGPPPG